MSQSGSVDKNLKGEPTRFQVGGLSAQNITVERRREVVIMGCAEPCQSNANQFSRVSAMHTLRTSRPCTNGRSSGSRE